MMEEMARLVAGRIDVGQAAVHVTVTLLCWLLTVAAILIDLWDGIYTARRLGERLHSHRFRDTVRKAGEYWRVLLFGFVADTLCVLFPWYKLPYLTMLVCMALIVIEARSVFEHIRRRKSGIARVPDVVGKIVECVTRKDAVRLIESLRDELDKQDGNPKKRQE